MVLVVADDLLFRSKISSVAKTLGITVRAATTPDAAIERAPLLQGDRVKVGRIEFAVRAEE